jgi:hypothetical protein
VRLLTVLAVCVAALIGLTALVAGGSALGRALFEQSDHEAVRLDGPVERVELELSGGRVQVTGRPGPARLEQRREWLLSAPTVRRRLVRGTLQVHAGCGGWTLWSCRIELDVGVPPGVPVRASVRAGELRLTRVSGPLRLDVAAGGVELDAVRSRRVEADVSAGGLRGSLARAPRLLDLEMTAGGVELEVPRTSYAVDASSTAGDIHVEGITRDPSAPRVLRLRATAGGAHITGR